MYVYPVELMTAGNGVPRLEPGDLTLVRLGYATRERRRNRGPGTRLSLCQDTSGPAAQSYRLAGLPTGKPGTGCQSGALLPANCLAHLGAVSTGRAGCFAASPIAEGPSCQGKSCLAKGAGRGDEARAAGLWGATSHLDCTASGQVLGGKDRDCCGRAHRAAWPGTLGLRLPSPNLDGPPQGRGASGLCPKKDGIEALLSAGAQTAAPSPEASTPLAAIRHEVIDPANREAIDWACGLLISGQADLYPQDEADLALLPSLTRTWMVRGEQLKVKAPGTNEKRSVSAAIDFADGVLLWRTDEKRDAKQFCATLGECAERSMGRGRIAVVLTDNAKSHRVGKTGIVRTALNDLAGRVVLVFLPTYSPDLQPAERLWRQWRPNVTHNHTREKMVDLLADSDGWLSRIAADPGALLRALGNNIIVQPTARVA